jgi:hypothetical protein
MPRRVTARLEGQVARLGEVPASDIARLILGIERAIGRSAARIIGRRPGTGRRGALVEAATHLKLVALVEGSIAPVLELPLLDVADEGALDLDVADLGELAVDATLDLLESDDPNPDVAQALSQLYDELGIGARYERLTISSDDGGHDRQLVLNPTTRRRIVRIAEGPNVQKSDDNVVGTLVEADFERRSARLRSSVGHSVVVSFTEDLADEIQEVLRRQAQLRGLVHYDEGTGQANRIEVQRILRTEQLLIGIEPEEFWSHQSVSDLITQHSGSVASSLEDIFDSGATDQEHEAFLNALAE